MNSLMAFNGDSRTSKRRSGGHIGILGTSFSRPRAPNVVSSVRLKGFGVVLGGKCISELNQKLNWMRLELHFMETVILNTPPTFFKGFRVCRGIRIGHWEAILALSLALCRRCKFRTQLGAGLGSPARNEFTPKAGLGGGVREPF